MSVEYGTAPYGTTAYGGPEIDLDTEGGEEVPYGINVYGTTSYGGPSPSFDNEPPLRTRITNGAFEITPKSNFQRLLRALTVPFDVFDDRLSEVYAQRFLDTATGISLDRIGALANVTRKSNEKDPKYRERIRVEFFVGQTGCTFDETAEIASLLLSTELDNIEFTYDYANEPATVIMHIREADLDRSPFTTDEIGSLMDRAVPAGHDVEIRLAGSFILKDDSDTDDPEKGLTSDAIETGGGLAEDL